MATIKSEYYRFNGVSWDIHYFKTTIDMVDGLQTVLNGKLDISSGSYIKENDIIMNTNAFGGRKLYINDFNNALFLADKRFTVTTTGGTNVGAAFNGNYDGGYIISAGNTETITIDFNGNFPGYPYGDIFLSFYYQAVPESVTGRVYCNYEPHGIGWHDLNFTVFNGSIGNGGNSLILKARNDYYNISQLEITITARNEPTSGYNYTNLTSVDFKLDRPGANEMPFVTKYRSQKIYYDFDWVGGSPKLNGQDLVATNDARLTNARPASDVYAWAKAANKPSYAWSEITSKPTFATVATSGSYNDLSDKPTIPTIPSVMTTTEGNTGTATTQRTINAANLKAIILNHSPAGARPASDVYAWAKAANKPSYSWSEITSKPSVIIDGDARLTDARPASDVSSWAKAASKPSYAWSEITSKPSFATVATSGSYDDLTNKPSIPTVPSVMTTAEGNTGTATTQRTINAANLKAIILNHSPAGARPASDVSAWAKADNKPIYGWSDIISKPSWIGSSKPSYSWSEIGSKPSWIGASKPSYSWSEIGSKPLVVVNTSPHPASEMLIEGDFLMLKSLTDTFGLSDENVPYLRCGSNSDGTFEVYGSIYATGDILTNSRRVQKMSTPVNISSSGTLDATHLDTMIVCRNASAMTLTIPVQATLDYPPFGTEIHFFQYTSLKTTISPASGVTIISKGSKRAIDGQYAAATLKLIDNNVWILIGALQS